MSQHPGAVQEQPKQLLLLPDVGSETRDPRQNEHERPSRVLQQGLEAVEDLLIGPFAFIRKHVLALVEMDADNALHLGVLHHEVPDLGLGVSTLQRVTQGAQDLHSEVLPRDLSGQDAVNDPCGSAVRHDLGAFVELFPKALDLTAFPLAGFADHQHAAGFEWLPGKGFVGVGRVRGPRVAAREFEIEGRPALDILQAEYHRADVDDPERSEYFVPVEWLHTVPEADAVQELGMFGNQKTVCKPVTPGWRATVDQLKARFRVE